jgi:predicted O-methyltransferase YrrM
MDSRIGLPVLMMEDKKYDFIYIDGNHNTVNVLIDGLCAYHLLKDDGVLIFDDYEFTQNNVQTAKIAMHKLETMIPIEPILTTWQRAYVKK